MQANESITYNYTGKCQKITLKPGYYRIDCYGGKGGGNTGAGGNKATGYYHITNNTDLFMYIGGQSTSAEGGWNGGETVTESGVYGGGGATSVSLNGTEGSSDWNDPVHLNSLLIMAAGGQGQGKTGGATTGTYSSTRIDAKTEFVNRAGVQAGYIIPKTSGTLTFQSDGYSHDPYGFIDNANGKNIASDDDSGRSYTGRSWDFRIQMGISAGTQYVFRIGSYASSLGTTGWSNWWATFPESEVVLYTVVTSGGLGGGNDYFSNDIFDSSVTEYVNSDNGKIVITRIGHQVITENCTTDTKYVIGGEKVSLSVLKTLWLDGYAQTFVAFQINYPDINLMKEDDKYVFIAPINLDDKLPFGEPITIKAIFSKIRCNSNYYKDSVTQETFDFNKLL